MHNWWNDYIGIKYSEKGRIRSEGLDCWGLVRLVHAEQFNIDLPSLSDQYDVSDRDSIADQMVAHAEGWQKVDVQRSGDVVLFRIMGSISHIGIVTMPGFFLHVREGQESVVERLDSGVWKRRVAGIYRYKAGASVSISAVPHPLKTVRIDVQVPEGATVAQMVAALRDRYGVAPDYPLDGVVMVNGCIVEKADWELCIPTAGSLVEYRAVMRGSNAGRLLATAAIMVIAIQFAPTLVAAMGGVAPVTGAAAGSAAAAGVGVAGLSWSTSVAIAAMGINVAGSLLTNAIFPVRQASTTTTNTKPYLQGGSNSANQYGAIPVVLGRFRYTPPLGATSYTEAEGSNSYLRMLLVWGFGPLQISDIEIGGTSIDSYDEVEYETVQGYESDDLTRLKSLYGTDTAQVVPNVELTSYHKSVESAYRSGNYITVTFDDDDDEDLHDFLPDMVVWCSNGLSGTVTSVSDYSVTFYNAGSDGSLSISWIRGSAWTESSAIESNVDRITVCLYFPSGLYGIKSTNGDQFSVNCQVSLQVRQVGSDTWDEVTKTIYQQAITLQSAYYNTDDDAELEDVYRWTRVTLDANNQIVVRHGAFTEDPNAEPSGLLLTRLQNETYGLDIPFTRLPAIGDDEEELWQICVHGNEIYSTVDKRTSVSGCALSTSGLVATIGAGTISRTDSEYISLTKSTKTSFSHNVTFYVPRGKYEVRARRTNKNNTGVQNAYDTVYLETITGYTDSDAINPPKPLAMTAIRIKATNQIDGTADGISGTVQVICPDYDADTWTWITRATRNPASLIRHAWQHPANAKALPDSRINIADLEDFHTYCKENGWAYNAILQEQRSLDEVVRDIAAAGRASPTERDGKKTVIIDRPRSTIVQHFTPHNSWGFESTKALPKMPHGWRVQFNNENRSFQADEYIVYADGYEASNATLFEGLVLPGVTNPDLIFKHGRFHLAQLMLRPEAYTINADFEHIVCGRGDLTQVSHGVPMWGIGSGRIKSRVDGFTLLLDETMPMESGKQYTIRIRLADGSSVTRTVVAKTEEGYYDEISVVEELTTTQAEAGNQFMFGELDSESVPLIVQSIEPAENMTARITYVDYSPAVYESDSETIPAFESKITKSAVSNIINSVPTVTGITSDESVVLRTSSGYTLRIRIGYKNHVDMESNVTHVQAQLDFADDNTNVWQYDQKVDVTTGSVIFDTDIQQGSAYKIRLRYIDANSGRTGAWVTTENHTVVGLSTLPPDITDFSVTNGAFSWSWSDVIDIVGSKIKFHYGSNASWSDATDLHDGLLTTNPYTPDLLPSGSITLMIKLVDAAGNESENPGVIYYNFGDVIVDNVILSYDDKGAGFPGEKTNCSVVSGNLIADDSGDLFWGSDSAQFWGNDAAEFWPIATYKEMTYVVSYMVSDEESGARLSVLLSISASAYSVEYRFDTQGKFWGDDDDYFWGSDSSKFWPVPTSWKTWPGSIDSIPSGLIELRITTQEGEIQGSISELTLQFDVDDESETINDFAVLSGGSRVPLTKSYRSLKNIRLDLQSDGGGAISASYADKSLDGPLIYCLDGDGAKVAGTVDVTVQGVKG